MKSLGIVRKVDELGRIVLPSEIRKVMNLEAGESAEFFIDSDALIIKRYSNGCYICKEQSKLTEVKGFSLCKKCLDDFNKAKNIIDKIDDIRRDK